MLKDDVEGTMLKDDAEGRCWRMMLMLVQPIPSGDGDWGRNHNEQRRDNKFYQTETCNEYKRTKAL